MSARCGSCGASIFWAVTAQGKKIPINYVPVPDGNIVIVPAQSNEESALARYLGRDEVVPAGTLRYTTHFVDCPNAKKHRKPKVQGDLFGGKKE